MTVAQIPGLAPPTSPWNSLESAKFIVSILTPIMVAVIAALIAFWLNKRMRGIEQLQWEGQRLAEKRLEDLQWAGQKIAEKRLDLYNKLMPLLNKLLCYFTYVGTWAKIPPTDMIDLKRELDGIAYINAPLLPTDFFDKYQSLIDLCFRTHSGWGRAAKLRCNWKRRKDALADKWNSEWPECFVEGSDCSPPEKVQAAYMEVVTVLANGLGIGVGAVTVPVGKIPANIC